MQLYNTLDKKISTFKPLDGNTVRLYSCGPTVYDNAHIGNLSSFIVVDVLKRTLRSAGFEVEHVMNMTDVDDKTITRSRERYPELEPREALKKLTREYEEVFKKDMMSVGNTIDDIEFVRATESIPEMQVLISELHDQGYAYAADDGIYFSIAAYKKSGKTYGQLTTIDSSNTSQSRIANDEYDKESAHDFALWKKAKANEPSWPFELGGEKVDGRPGWHIECSVMSTMKLTQPFDIHTGGIDLIFPHHENEIAQSTATRDDPMYAHFFVHSEHLLVDGKKMSKSLNNFYTLKDIVGHDFDPLAFRLMVLQSHYRKQSNFTWDALQAAQNRLKELRSLSALRWQAQDKNAGNTHYARLVLESHNFLLDDLNTPQSLASLSSVITEDVTLNNANKQALTDFIQDLDETFGFKLSSVQDISSEQKNTIEQRQVARDKKDWAEADKLRDRLVKDGIELRDTPAGQIWNYA